MTLPTANLVSRKPAKQFSWWLIAVISVCASLGSFLYVYRNSGTSIVVEFQEGHGIKPEDRLRHHGIDIGEVTKVELSGDMTRVLVSIRLQPNASDIAREGTQFWIVRPSLSFDSISGLDTILGAKYLSVKPGARDARRTSRFIGLEVSPIASPKDGSLEITLDGSARGGLSNGAPILYRGYRIGSIVQVGLATDARSVRARCAIDPEYRDLVRPSSRFWNRSGWKLKLGLTGVKIDAESLAQILTGGIEMATPQSNEPTVSTGHSFVLYDEAQPEWLAWQPSIGHGVDWQEKGSAMPLPIRMALRWQERTLGFRTNKQISGWCLPLDDGSFLCPMEQIVAPSAALKETVVLEFAGVAAKQEDLILEIITGTDDKLVRFRTSLPIEVKLDLWPASRLARSDETDSSFVVSSGDPAYPIIIDGTRIKKTDSEWRIESGIISNADLVGAPVVDYLGNNVVGVIGKQGKEYVIVPIR
ncbi:MlaD family protein [Pirellulaceae bacterium SH449]